ncbi:Lrp/AsnC family transcriptional regulator [Notoacmeibacter ruber]|uniref:Lrp/AsnC family transcriptional regulator n=1 Tax=Notoacmeibacter ruber TaxID=2670375 RepID=A0A3L7JFF7_9HYPH|nr:Lrp/AsnC family transcriptional regulator [Notoacmeibacter ruber]RLQ89194.1 Lrp/AsnC family transcriptional regulator [Notoacmeibacter ruber]
MRELSDVDRSLLAALRTNSRASITELSHLIGVSRATVKARLELLVQEGRIRRFTIETDVDVEGEVKAIMMIELQGKLSRAVIGTLRRIPEISAIHSTNGVWDLVVEIKTDSLVQFDRVLRDIREIPGVNNSQTSILLAPVTG